MDSGTFGLVTRTAMTILWSEGTLYPWRPLVAPALQRQFQIFVQLVEFIDEHLLEGVSGAKLIDFVAACKEEYCILLKIQVWS